MFVDKLLLWLHVAAAMFTIGPVTVATSFTPRFIRNGELSVVRFLLRLTRVFGLLTLLAFLTGLILGRDRLAAPWLTVSMTLFVVAAVLLALVHRDQSAAVKAMSTAAAEVRQATAAELDESTSVGTDEETDGAEPAPPATTDDAAPGRHAGNGRSASGTSAQTTSAQTGRIAAFSGLTALLWLVILVFMVWQPGG